MEMRALGQTGIEVGVIGLGTVKFGRNEGVKYPQAFELPSDEQVEELLACAAELGVNLIDTAPAYGTSEARIGKAMRENGWFGGREKWCVMTKVGEEFEDGTSMFDFSRAGMRASVMRSCERLGVDRLDVVLIHSNGEDERIIEQDKALETLAELRDEGVVRAIGMSTKTVSGGLMAVNELGAMGGGVIMLELNKQHTEQVCVLEAARTAQVGVVVKKALGSGHVHAEEVGEALNFALSGAGRGGVSSVIVGTLSAEHLRANVQAVGGWKA